MVNYCDFEEGQAVKVHLNGACIIGNATTDSIAMTCEDVLYLQVGVERWAQIDWRAIQAIEY